MQTCFSPNLKGVAWSQWCGNMSTPTRESQTEPTRKWIQVEEGIDNQSPSNKTTLGLSWPKAGSTDPAC